jgi:hypothetical protein
MFHHTITASSWAPASYPSFFKHAFILAHVHTMDNSDAPPSYHADPLPSSICSAAPMPELYFDNSAFIAFVKRCELSDVVANQLKDVLEHREIVLLCDDSSSMMSLVIEEGNDPFAANNMTRWMLLKKIAASVIDFVTSISHHGLDLYFLKRPTVRNVNSVQGLQGVFQYPPDESGTPLIGALRRIYGDKRGVAGLLIVVITDGEPNDGSREDLRRVLLEKPADCHISFAEATDQEDDMQYLDAFKGQIPLFDNTDIYRLECQRVKAIQGQLFKFDFQDWAIKVLLSTFLPSYWLVDQRKMYGSTANATMLYQPRVGGSSASPPALNYQAPAQYSGAPLPAAYQTALTINNASRAPAACCQIM